VSAPFDVTADRRGLIGLLGTGVAASFARPSAAREGAPPDVGRKFYPDGRVKRFDGNTIICHLDQQGPNAATFNALLDIYRDAPRHAFMRKVTLLPPSSYHMTIFGAANDPDRRPGAWPADIPMDMPIARCSVILGDRLRAANFGIDRPIHMRIDDREPKADERPLTIRLLPIDAAEDRRLRDLRNQLADILKIRVPTHDAYSFHITLGYLIRWLSVSEQRDFRRSLAIWREGLIRTAPIIEFGAPEYCILKDMFAFQRQFFLQ
jgi:hypothetical protein